MKKIKKSDLEIKPRVISQLNDTPKPNVENCFNMLLSMGKVKTMFAMRISRALMAVLLGTIGCMYANAEESASVTISGIVLTEPGGKPLKKAKVRVFWPERDFVGLTKKSNSKGEFSFSADGCLAGTLMVLQPIKAEDKPSGILELLNNIAPAKSNVEIMEFLAESTITTNYFTAHPDGSVNDAILSIAGVYGDNLNYYRDHKVISILIDGERWMSDMQKLLGRASYGVYSSLNDMTYLKSNTGYESSEHRHIAKDLQRDIDYKNIVRIDYLSPSQRIVSNPYTAPGGVILITTKADPEMKWVDDLRLTMVEL